MVINSESILKTRIKITNARCTLISELMVISKFQFEEHLKKAPKRSLRCIHNHIISPAATYICFYRHLMSYFPYFIISESKSHLKKNKNKINLSKSRSYFVISFSNVTCKHLLLI